MLGQRILAEHKALVLVGGLGTRLKSVYSEGPKAMAPIRGKPFLDHLLRGLARAGFVDVVLCVGYRHEPIREFFGDGSRIGLNLHYSIERELLGTAGAIRLGAIKFASGERVFAINGDTLHPIDYTEMLRFHNRKRANCTITLAEVQDAVRYGSVELQPSGRVIGFLEKNAPSGRSLVNSGTYIFEPNVIDAIPADRPVSLEREVLPLILGELVVGFTSQAYFIDIGVPADYIRAQTELEEL